VTVCNVVEAQAAFRALDGPKVKSDLVVECLNALSGLAGENEVILAWVPGHSGIQGNEEADLLARRASGLPLQGPEPALGIPRCSAREAIRAWTMKLHFCTWKDLTGHRHGKLFISGPCRKRADDLLKLGRHQLKMVVATLTGHGPVRKHLRILGLFEGDPTCRFCRQGVETVQHIICCCEALARKRYNVCGRLVVEPTDIRTAIVKDLCLFIRGTGLWNLG
jgi:hypothetical protein